MTIIKHDIHIHSFLSACCPDKDNQVPEKIIKKAEQIGLETIGFADHCWANPALRPSSWYEPQNERQIIRLKNALASIETDLRVMVGIEAETVAPGQFGVTPEFAESLDYVLLSCSHFHMKDFVQGPTDNQPKTVAEYLVTFFKSAINSGIPTSIAHPFLPFGFTEIFDDTIKSISDSTFTELFSQAKENGIGIEITLSYFPHGSGNWSLETPLRFLSLAKDAGCKFTFGSDAHTLDRLDRISELSYFTENLDLSQENILI